MIATSPPDAPAPADEADDDLLTRQEASVYLRRFAIRLKPTSLARMWSVGADGPPCTHVRNKPWYPRGALRTWAESQATGLRRSARDPKAPGESPP